MKLHCNTATLLPTAAKAPPLELGLTQFMKVTPTMVRVELLMSKAAPGVRKRRLQSNIVADGTPLMVRDAKLLMLTVGSR